MGDRRALAELYDRYATTLLALAQRFLGSLDAEDLIHDLFIEVWLRADSYDPERGSVRAWLLLRTRSRALDRLKSAAYRRALRSEPSEDLGHPDDAQPTDEALARRATHREMQTAIRILSEEERGLLDLIYHQGCSLAEAAGQLDTPLGTVKSRLNRVLVKLRRTLIPVNSEV